MFPVCLSSYIFYDHLPITFYILEDVVSLFNCSHRDYFVDEEAYIAESKQETEICHAN